MADPSRLPIVDECRLGGSLAFSVDNALTLATIQRHGHEPAEEIQFRVLRSHQEHFFLQGLKKLGLDREESDAVRCAKFHVLSNHLGGLRVRYARESADKAWVVYDTPYWIDSPWTPSVAVAAIRPNMLIRTMQAWHANNGVLLGNPGLAYVQTTLVPRGDACDAGYFLDTHRTLKPEERMRLRFDEGIPKGLKLEAPALDEKVWPLDRQARAWRNFSVAYVGGRLYWLIRELGEAEAVSLFEHALKLTLLQHRENLAGKLALAFSPGPARAAALWAGWHHAWGDEVRVTPLDGGRVLGEVVRSRIHEVGEFAPAEAPFPRALEDAAARAWATLIDYDDPSVAVEPGDGAPRLPWRFVFGRR
jgi:hypothetical protein